MLNKVHDGQLRTKRINTATTSFHMLHKFAHVRTGSCKCGRVGRLGRQQRHKLLQIRIVLLCELLCIFLPKVLERVRRIIKAHMPAIQFRLVLLVRAHLLETL